MILDDADDNLDSGYTVGGNNNINFNEAHNIDNVNSCGGR